MRRSTSEWTVRMLADLHGRINTEAEYQRGEVWSTPQQQLLIDSILRGFDLPKIFFRKLEDGSPFLFDVVDGVQRLTAIWNYLADEYPLPRSYSYKGLGDVGGLRWYELPQDAQDRLQFAKVTVTELETDSDEDIRELFQRLQKGEPLNAAERRNAMTGPVRDFVADTLASHRLWPETGLRSNRFGWHEMSAIALAIVRKGGPTGLKGADLLALYEDDSFDPNGNTAQQAQLFLDRLYEVARVREGAIRTRWGIVDLLTTLMRIVGEGEKPSPTTIMQFFTEFEEERRAATTELSDLRATVTGLTAEEEMTLDDLELPSIRADMLTYVNAFSREGAVEGNVTARSDVMTARLRQYVRALQ